MRVPLNEQKTATVAANGVATASIGPLTGREVWWPDQVRVSVSSRVLESTIDIYIGDSVRPSTFRDHGINGSTGTASGLVQGRVPCGWKVWAVWTGADVGATATLVITGEKEV